MSMASDHSTDTPLDALDIVSTRVFGIPREVVFHAFTDPVRLARWWGPKGFTNTFHHFAPQPGGTWRFTMHGPDGTDYDIEKEFAELVPPERIVLQHLDPMHRFRMTMLFSDEGFGTRLTWRMRFESQEEAIKVREFVVSANEENFDRLQALLETKV